MNAKWEELLDKALAGDVEAYGELIKMILPELNYIAKLKLRNQEDASEAVQETLENSFKYLKTLGNKEEFKPWILKILNTACDRIYLIKKKDTNLLSKIAYFTRLDKVDNPIEEFEKDEDFRSMLKVLNKKEKEIVILYYKYEYSTGQIAYILQKSVNTVKSQLLRAKKKLEKYAEEVKYIGTKK